MGVTRRYWGEVGLVVALAGLAVAFERSILFVGAGAIGGATLARQYAFVRHAAEISADLSVSQSPERDRAVVGDEVSVRLDARLPRPTAVRVEVEAEPPVGVEVTGGRRRVALAVGERTATGTFGVRCELAGEFEFGRPAVTVADASGRFRTAFPATSGPTVTVKPRERRPVQTGASTERPSASRGDRDAGVRGPGLDIEGIRPYVPGDPVRRLDWNATARLGDPYVREFETDADRRTVLLVDRRPSTALGAAGETQLDYLRQVALGVLEDAREENASIGLSVAGADGVLARSPPAATAKRYAEIERELRALAPEEPTGESDGQRRPSLSPATARRRSHLLRGDDSAFAAALEPFFAAVDPYVERIEGDALYGAARTHLGRRRGAVTTVVLTDDTNRAELREIVQLARRRGGRVVAFLTPSVLFEIDEIADAETAYERYADFERFRRGLDRLGRVSAFEVGPSERLDAVSTTESARSTTEFERLAAEDERSERAEVGD